jgi:hypothetical protein
VCVCAHTHFFTLGHTLRSLTHLDFVTTWSGGRDGDRRVCGVGFQWGGDGGEGMSSLLPLCVELSGQALGRPVWWGVVSVGDRHSERERERARERLAASVGHSMHVCTELTWDTTIQDWLLL